MTADDYFSFALAVMGGFLSFFFGGLDNLLKALIIFAILDQITGVMKGYVLKEWSSEIGFHGIARKVCMFMLVGMANIVGHELPILGLGHPETLRDAIATFYLATESISIIENAIDLGVPIPAGFKDKFLAWRNKQLNKQLMSKNDPAGEED